MPKFEVQVWVVPAVDLAHEPAPIAGLRVRREICAMNACIAAHRLRAELDATDMVGCWTARRRGLLGIGRRWSGRFGPDDDGLSGVREPRRPHPSAGSASVALDLPRAG